MSIHTNGLVPDMSLMVEKWLGYKDSTFFLIHEIIQVCTGITDLYRYMQEGRMMFPLDMISVITDDVRE